MVGYSSLCGLTRDLLPLDSIFFNLFLFLIRMVTKDVMHVHNTPSSHSHDLKSILVTFQFSSVQSLKVMFSWGLLAYVGNFGMFQIEFFKFHIACRARVQ